MTAFCDPLALPTGQWVYNRRTGVSEFRPADPDWSPETWPAPEQRRAHAAFMRGLRDSWTVTGERRYQRDRQRRKRARLAAGNAL